MFFRYPPFNHVKRFKGPPFLYVIPKIMLITNNIFFTLPFLYSLWLPNVPTNNREALHTKLRKRFHLEPLKQLIEQGYISDCVIIEIRQAIERWEADRTASRKKEDNQPKLTAFYMSSTCSNSEKLDGDTDSESTSTSSTNNDSDSENA